MTPAPAPTSDLARRLAEMRHRMSLSRAGIAALVAALARHFGGR